MKVSVSAINLARVNVSHVDTEPVDTKPTCVAIRLLRVARAYFTGVDVTRKPRDAPPVPVRAAALAVAELEGGAAPFLLRLVARCHCRLQPGRKRLDCRVCGGCCSGSRCSTTSVCGCRRLLNPWCDTCRNLPLHVPRLRVVVVNDPTRIVHDFLPLAPVFPLVLRVRGIAPPYLK